MACSNKIAFGIIPCLGVIYQTHNGNCSVLQYEMPQMIHTGGENDTVEVYANCEHLPTKPPTSMISRVCSVKSEVNFFSTDDSSF